MRHLIVPTYDNFNSNPSDEISFERKGDLVKVAIPGNGEAGTRYLSFEFEEWIKLVTAIGLS